MPISYSFFENVVSVHKHTSFILGSAISLVNLCEISQICENVTSSTQLAIYNTFQSLHPVIISIASVGSSRNCRLCSLVRLTPIESSL